jgi:predicted acetyltransferase
MTIEIKACTSVEDLGAAIAPIWHYFGASPSEQTIADFAELMTPQRALAAVEDGAVVGGSGTFAFDLTTPGGHVRAAGLTMVGVAPTHRRRGILTGLMRRTIDEARQRNEPVAYLWASEDAIYGRFGFGLSCLSADIDLPRASNAFVVPRVEGVRVRRIPLDGDVAPLMEIFATVASKKPGAFARSAEWWKRKVLRDPPWLRRGGGDMQCVLVEIDGTPCAYAFYRVNSNITRGIQAGGVDVIEAVGTSPEATLAVWRFLLDIDWSARVRAQFLPLDHPLLLLAREPRHLNFRQRDGTWLRILDVQGAMAARAFGPSDEIVIEVDDSYCPWNAGRWLVREGGAEKTSRAADLRCDAGALACVYLGGFTWRHLVAASRATATSDEAILRADRVFERRDAPWCPEIF